MAEQIIFQCNDCGFYFRSSDMGVHISEECFCHHCGNVFGDGISGDSRAIPKVNTQNGDLGKCDECEGKLTKRVVAMCPRCQAKDVKIQGTVSYF